MACQDGTAQARRMRMILNDPAPGAGTERLPGKTEAAGSAASPRQVRQELEQHKTESGRMLWRVQETPRHHQIREKLTALGELTAEVAHEIRNPLNFVNNFSELSEELIEELRLELSASPGGLPVQTRARVAELIDALADNLRRIRKHGDRADAVVQGMLEHARSAPDDPEPSNLNALLREFVPLALRQFRSRHDVVQATVRMRLDDAIGEVRVKPRSISRVVLNLVNNALYAVHEKRLRLGRAYEPVVTVSSLRKDGFVEVRVRDNGDGVPESDQGRIFEPFFTTKPAHAGVGLGLSICYDIVVREHGGELFLVSEPGAYAEFIVRLPQPGS